MTLTGTTARMLALLSAALLFGTSDHALCAQASIVTSSRERVSGVKRIEIESSAWSGRKTVRQKMAIRATKAGYAAGTRKVDSDAIRDLLSRLNSPQRTLSLEALGINLDWLRQSGFDEASFLKAVNRYYNDSVILDVDAEFKLELAQVDGSRIVVRSSRSHAYMIPWKITTPDGGFENYDAGVSRAIVRLLPDGFLNRLLIAGTPHGRDFSYEIAPAGTPSPQ